MIKNSILFLLLFTSISAFAIPTDSIFLNITDNILPLVSKKNRYELAEYYKVGKSDSIANIFGKQVYLQKYDTANCHIVLKTSETSTFELKRISIPNITEVYGIIRTISKPFPQSYLKFYDSKWNEIHKTLNFPSVNSWFDFSKINTSEHDAEWINRLISKEYLSFIFTSDNKLEIKNNVLQTLQEVDRKIIEPAFSAKTQQITL